MPQDIPATGLGNFHSLYPVSTPLFVLRKKLFACSQDPNLYPTHPSQALKEYHEYDRARYDQALLDGRNDACLVSQVRAHPAAKPLNPARVARIIEQAEAAGRRIACLMADAVHRVALSDTYIDACGNYYRGVERLTFLESEENMGTLFAPGRSTYNIGADVNDGQYSGHTWAVPSSEFAFLAELLPGDMGKIARERERARATHTLDAAGRIFSLKK